MHAMGITGEVEQHEIDAWLGDARTDMTDEQYAEFTTYAKANPEGDWTYAHQEITELRPAHQADLEEPGAGDMSDV
jgi:hypothetical protein